MARKSQTRKICGTQLIFSVEHKETGLEPQALLGILDVNSTIWIQSFV